MPYLPTSKKISGPDSLTSIQRGVPINSVINFLLSTLVFGTALKNFIKAEWREALSNREERVRAKMLISYELQTPLLLHSLKTLTHLLTKSFFWLSSRNCLDFIVFLE